MINFPAKGDLYENINRGGYGGYLGVVHWDQISSTHPEYTRFRRIMAGDVNVGLGINPPTPSRGEKILDGALSICTYPN